MSIKPPSFLPPNRMKKRDEKWPLRSRWSNFENRAQFGKLVELPTGATYIIPAHWQSLWNALAQLSTALGALLIAPASDRLGRRFALVASGVVCAAGIAILYTCEKPGTFLAGKMLNALGLGMSISTGQTYIAEVTPLKIRGILLSIQSPFLVSLHCLLRLWCPHLLIAVAAWSIDCCYCRLQQG